jgi:YVTN family beta-propeller protein
MIDRREACKTEACGALSSLLLYAHTSNILMRVTLARIRPRFKITLIVMSFAAVVMAAWMRAADAPPPPPTPGTMSDGTTLLPNGWRVTPAGRHTMVGDLPLNLVQSPDSRYVVVTNNGLAKPSFSVIDVANWSVKSTVALEHAWLGLAWHPDGTKLYSAGAKQENVQEFAYADGVLTRARTFKLPDLPGDGFAGGLTVSRDGRWLYVTRVFGFSVSAIDLTSGQVVNTTTLAAEPYTCVVSPDGRTLYVSLWGGARVEVLQAPSLTLVNEIDVGEHPNAMVLSPDGRRLFVASGNTASVWVYDTFSFEPIEQISMSLFPEAPPTATPNALAVSPDGRTLLVANADTNTVAVVDVGNSNGSFVEGFIPTGWYPTGAIFSRDGKQIFVLSGKGLKPSPNPTNNGLDRRLFGAASSIPTPDRTTLAEYTRKVYALTPYRDATRLAPASAPAASPIPREVGANSPIKHVFYVIRENRTYDQVLGDVRAGNGDASMNLFGRDVTPNAHAMADGFVLFDNFYVDADVSYNGHAYSTAAYATDFVQKMWQTYYANRGGLYLSEGGGFLRNPYGNIAAPLDGYLWDFARRANVTVRSYGEFVHNHKNANGDTTCLEAVPGLKGLVAPAYAGFDLDITDNRRIDAWLAEFRDYVANGNLPALSIIRLGNDHTQGAKPGAPTPRAMMADNDLALGRLVEAISTSVYWKDSVVVALEDDAQSGPDHVDSHRSVLLVASPFARRTAADHTFYSTSSVLRTMELILGLPPMSTYDASAAPLYNAFQPTPNLTPFHHYTPNVALDEKNPPSASGASASAAMDFSDADRAPEALLNEIIWRSVKGAASKMPPMRRSVFVRQGARPDVDDDDR